MAKKPAGSAAVKKIPSRGIKDKTGTAKKQSLHVDQDIQDPPPESAPPPPVVIVPPTGEPIDTDNPSGVNNKRGSNASLGGEDEGPNSLRPAAGLQPPSGAKYKSSKSKGSKKKDGKRGKGRFIIKNLWEVCCNEIDAERKEVDNILKKTGVHAVQYRRRKSYGLLDYDGPPDMDSCMSKDFLDFYVFPTLLPAIQALIRFARVNRIFQSKYATFNPLDFIVEYLHNNNPRYPERVQNPTPIFDIPFCKEWLERNPRDPPPKWLIMSSDAAAVTIQKCVRGFLVRSRPDVAEMRQFWAEFRKDMKEEQEMEQRINTKLVNANKGAQEDPKSENNEEMEDEEEGTGSSEIVLSHDDIAYDAPPDPIVSLEVSHHSDTCVVCDALRKFLEKQPEHILKSYKRAPSISKTNLRQKNSNNNTQNNNQNKRKSSEGGTSQGEAVVGLESDPQTPRKSTPGESTGLEVEGGASTKKGSVLGSRPSTSRLKKSEKHGGKSDRPNTVRQNKKDHHHKAKE